MSALRLAIPHIVREELGQGAFVLRSVEPLQAVTRCVGEWLEHWAKARPDTVFLAERTPDGASWRTLSYAEVRATIGRIAQHLLDMQLPTGRPITMLSDNSVDQALLTLAALHVGIPVSMVSSAYTRMARDHTKLHGILRMVEPAMLYASDGAIYGEAIRTADLQCPVVFSTAGTAGSILFETLLLGQEGAAVMDAFAKITPETHAKYLLTSGSTGTPKMVINTHHMLCANQQMIAQMWPFMAERPPVVLDWLPWSHTFGTNHNFNLVLRNGGTLYVDEGRPMPGLVEKTVRNLQDVKPTLFFNVPKGYDTLLPFLEADTALAEAFFGRLDALFYAAAALPQSAWERLEAVAAKVRSTPVFFTSAWGATETSPLITSLHFKVERAGNIGVPAPGMSLKFVPNGEKLEMRVKGPSVFPGYRGAPELTAKAFDEDGYYMIGDAGKLADANNPNAGVLFDGRVSEDFKLTSGTWVSVGTFRIRAVSAFTPYAQDAVITGHDRDEVGVMLFPSPALRHLANDHTGTMRGEDIAAHPEVRATLAKALSALNAGQGSAGRATRLIVLSSPPDLGLGETTDKGYINQRAVLSLRADEVLRLYAGGASVIFPA